MLDCIKITVLLPLYFILCFTYIFYQGKTRMIQDKTTYFMNLRKTPSSFTSTITINPILLKLEVLNNKVTLLNKKLERNSLPSFDSKIVKQKEIAELRGEIQNLSNESEEEINSFSITNKCIANSIRMYLLNNFRQILSNYKLAEQKNLVQVDESIKSYEFGDELIQETVQRSNNIKANILNLTNTLIQLKMALKSQSTMIDSIDHYFDQANEYLRQANKQIAKIPEKYTRFKDWIIYFLTYVICVLLSMILVKTYLHRDLHQSK